MANSTKKTKGIYVSDPTEVKKGGWVKKMFIGVACAAVIAVSAVGGVHHQKYVYQKPEAERYEQTIEEKDGIISELQDKVAELEENKGNQGGENTNGGENNNEGENNNGGENSGENNNENDNQGGNGGENNNENDNQNNGENQGGEQGGEQTPEEVVELTQEEQASIAAGIYTDLREGLKFDATTLTIEGTKLVADGDTNYLQAYISIMEGEDKVMYVVGYEGIENAEDIPMADIRTIKAGTVADIQKYISVEEYVDETKVEGAKDYIETTYSLENIDELYVRVTNSNRKGKFTSTLDYIAVGENTINPGTIVNEGQEYNVSYSELLDMVMGLNETTTENATETTTEMTR